MRISLTLRRQIWNQFARKRFINESLDLAALKLENRIKGNIDASQPAGRVRRLSTLTGRRTASSVGNRRRGTSTRIVIGAEFYRTSAPGQPPAKRTGALYRKIRVTRVDDRSLKAVVGVSYAKYLDDPSILNRPFFRQIVREYFRTEFRNDVKTKLRELLNG